MPQYTINTNLKQEAGLKFAYEIFADKSQFPTQELYFQSRIEHQVTNLMYNEFQRALGLALDQSIKSVPEDKQDVARAAIAAIINENGGIVYAPGVGMTPTIPPFPPRQS